MPHPAGILLNTVSSSVFALSIHADYKCRNSGACCSAGWDVPIEIPIYHSLQEAMAAGLLHTSADAGSRHPFITEPDVPEDVGAMFEVTDEGRCVFFDRSDHLCIVHRDLGEDALPMTCRHFPRLAVRDRRGTFLTLSHFCPTAASMLFRDVPVRVVEHPPAFPPSDYEGLVVEDDAFPPLLTPTMLMDLDGYTAWERHMVAVCADTDRHPEQVLATLVRDARILGRWKPGGPTLVEAVAALPRDTVDAELPATLEGGLARHREVVLAMPEDLRPDSDEADLEASYQRYLRAVWSEYRAPLNRYLAGKAFASWSAYQGRGIATIVRGLEAALAMVRVEASRECRNAGHAIDPALLLQAFRSADFALNHLAVGEDLCDIWAAAEGSSRE
jgi:Fe-S-cluster containining protein